jgi:hypothetical protein
MTISLAFLAPDLVKAAIEGRLPRGIGVARLCDSPAEWCSHGSGFATNPAASWAEWFRPSRRFVSLKHESEIEDRLLLGSLGVHCLWPRGI